MAPGYLPERRKTASGGESKSTPVYKALLQTLDTLTTLVRRSNVRDNKSIRAFTEALQMITEKYDF